MFQTCVPIVAWRDHGQGIQGRRVTQQVPYAHGLPAACHFISPGWVDGWREVYSVEQAAALPIQHGSSCSQEDAGVCRGGLMMIRMPAAESSAF